MAKVINPLLSISASGSIGRALIFLESKGVNIVKGFFVSPDKETAAQIAQRDLYKAGVAVWNSLTDEQKGYWVELAKGKLLTGFNIFMSDYLYTGGFPVTYGLYDEGVYGVDVYYE